MTHNQTKEVCKRFAKAIIENYVTCDRSDWCYCIHCGGENEYSNTKIKHEKDCIYLIAKNYLGE